MAIIKSETLVDFHRLKQLIAEDPSNKMLQQAQLVQHPPPKDPALSSILPPGAPLGKIPVINSINFDEPSTPAQVHQNLDPYKVLPATKRRIVVTNRELPDSDTLTPSEPAFNIDNPVMLHQLINPKIKLYDWQFEELMRIGGYPVKGKYAPANKIIFNTSNTFRGNYPCANGSGKDMYLIALSTVWFMLTGQHNRVVGTSSSQEQLKYQTEKHIINLCDSFNKKLGRKAIHNVEFHFQTPSIASEIKLFATNKAGRAEGYHPYGNGKMMLFTNESKSLDPDIVSALSRCFGWTYWLNVSSPGEPKGFFYNACKNSIQYPNPYIPNVPYCRHVHADECPHITESDKQAIEFIAGGKNTPLYQSSVCAQFVFLDSGSIINDAYWYRLKSDPPKHVGTDIGIGLDIALGGGDFTWIIVRQGNKVIHHAKLNHSDPDVLCAAIDKELAPWKGVNYHINADNGGIGLPILRLLAKYGWKVTLCNNQSPASKYGRRFFLNLGAEMWFHTRSLIINKLIILPNIYDLEEQITKRKTAAEPNPQGRVALEPKKEHKKHSSYSPDAADAFVLAFYSFRPNSTIFEDNDKVVKPVSVEELNLLLRNNPEVFDSHTPKSNGTITIEQLGQTLR